MTARPNRFSYRPRPRAYWSLRLLHLDAMGDGLERIHHALEAEIAHGERRLETAEREGRGETCHFLVDDECHEVEELLGIAFVAAQPFINRIKKDFCSLNRICKEDYGRELDYFASGGKAVDLPKWGEAAPGRDVSLVEAIYAVGNFWKHSDEWPHCGEKTDEHTTQVWDRANMTRQQKATFDVVTVLGIRRGSTENLRHGAKAIGIEKYTDLSLMRKALKAWAQDVYTAAARELESLTALPTKMTD
ncbi:MAG TPA: hypothetical protein VHP14_17045 [Anaerolineales bacterium]|nr:hypothetical protein [Anaerolineales bacterium]